MQERQAYAGCRAEAPQPLAALPVRKRKKTAPLITAPSSATTALTSLSVRRILTCTTIILLLLPKGEIARVRCVEFSCEYQLRPERQQPLNYSLKATDDTDEFPHTSTLFVLNWRRRHMQCGVKCGLEYQTRPAKFPTASGARNNHTEQLLAVHVKQPCSPCAFPPRIAVRGTVQSARLTRRQYPSDSRSTAARVVGGLERYVNPPSRICRRSTG